MADSTRIFEGYYKGVPISISSGSIAGGRKTSIKQFPGRDTQSVEDLGLHPRAYSLDIVVNDKANVDYFAYRDRLLAALETKSPGELIHPLYGRIENVVAVSFSLNEDFGGFGSAIVTVQFEVNNNTGIPQSSGNAVTQLGVANEAVQAAVGADIAERFAVSSRYPSNFGAAFDKVNAIIDAAKASTAFIGEAADTLNEFSAEIGQLSANINSLVSDPLALAQAITGLFESVNGLYASIDATFDTLAGFFGFGDDDLPIPQDTAGRVEAQKNNDVLNGGVAASCLGYAYVAAAQINYQTTREIDAVAAVLDAQFVAVMGNGADTAVKGPGGASQEVKDAVTDMRVQVLAVLDETRLNTSQVITVETLPTSARLLAFAYYGSDELGQTIAELNEIDDVSFVSGEVEILSA